MDELQQYINKISQRYKTGISREHSYRGDLQNLLEALLPDVLVTNEPAHIACGAPDYILTKAHIPVGYIEAKDVGKPLDSKDYKEQFNRYRQSLDNLIITDYLEFRFYRDGEQVTMINVAEIFDGKLQARSENFPDFIDLIKDFAAYIGQTIKSPSKLSKMMAGKARLLASVIEKALTSDEENEADSTLKDQMRAFKSILIHDIEPKQFADIYAQTIAYGMFSARLHDETLDTFSRQEAAEYIPKSNPFLRKLFQYIAGYDLDERIVWIVDSLADIFRATDVRALISNFGKAEQKNDPIIHFYETFLAEYDPKLRKSRGVWYTPEPVVDFIVRAVDDLLKTEFNLPQGLADTSKTTIELDTQFPDRRSKTGYRRGTKEVHKVQILDPATGTGTFLAATIKHIHQKFEGLQGIWSQYVEEDLIPRVNGFEILMASYAMAHLKLDLLLKETGYKANKQPRLNIYLTNSLEEPHPDSGTLFASWLSKEASDANYVKRDTPVMVVMGNPPYSVSSSNKGYWIQDLIGDYKKGLNERKLNLDDDYIKFIRYGQQYIEKNGEGILAYISNNSFIDGITHRQMRKSLLEVFDKIYIIDLHGNSKRKETSLDGGKDENVFDIMQGVSINIFVKTRNKRRSEQSEILHYDVYGSRTKKYQTLWNSTIFSLDWNILKCKSPYFFFVPKDFETENNYLDFFSVVNLFSVNTSGIQTKRDKVAIQEKKDTLIKVLTDFSEMNQQSLRQKYSLPADGRDWRIKWASEHAKDFVANERELSPVLYRPFDKRWTILENRSKGFVAYPRFKVMSNMNNENLGLICTRQLSMPTFQHIWLTIFPIDGNTISLQTREYNYLFPLYLYSKDAIQQTTGSNSQRKPNLNPEIIKQITEKLDLTFTPEKEQQEGTFAPIDLLDYIYAVLHSPTYRETYKEFLKIDFPRIPYPDQDSFWLLVKLGSELRRIHLLESPIVEQFITTYPNHGDNIVTRKINKSDFEIIDKEKRLGRVWINDEQYFDQLPILAWEFYIGGYQPAQKWLKDRSGRTLGFEDILHYQKIIVALTETNRIMKEIDKNWNPI